MADGYPVHSAKSQKALQVLDLQGFFALWISSVN